MTEIEIAPHLERALELMSRDLSISREALVNQALFAWLRTNGYVAPGVAQPHPAVATSAPTPAPAPSLGASPLAATSAMPSASSLPRVEVKPPAPVAEVKAPESPAAPKPPEPQPPAVAAPVPEPVAPSSAPSGGQLAALARMKAISADLERLTRPWPAWVASEEAEDDAQEDSEEGEEEPEGAEEDEGERDEGEEDAARGGDEDAGDEAGAAAAVADTHERKAVKREVAPAGDEEPEGDPWAEDDQPARGGPTPDVDDEAARATSASMDADVNTGENEIDEPPAESTVVLRSVPIVLYLEREGEEPVRVESERFIIGRGPQCDLVIDSPRVSREHVALTRSGIRYFIEDLNSSNGTWLGEERVTRREIESGDVISLGNEPITFTLRGE